MTEENHIPSANLRPDLAERHVARRFALIFALLAVCAFAGGFFYYRNYERQFRAKAENELSAIADLKVSELAQWRKERLGDGGILFKNAAFTALVKNFLQNPEDAAAQPPLLNWMGKYSRYSQYDRVWLLDAQGATRLSIPAGQPPTAPATLQLASTVMRSGQPALQDFYRNEHDGRVYLAVMVPILDETTGSPPLGVLVLRIDPSTYLFPFIQRWPVPSRTAETLLVRREGAEAVFLNELRFQTNTALNLRASREHTDMPAVKAALGQEKVEEGRDYRGEPVLAATRVIPDSPWFLVARRDVDEVFAPLKEQLGQVVAGIVILIFGAGAGVGLVWRQQRVRFYLERATAAAALIASEARYRRFFEATRDGILILDAETGLVLDVNPFLIELLGYSHEVFLGKKIWELGFFKDILANQDNFAELLQKKYLRYENLALETSAGRRIEVEFTSHVYQVDRQTVVQCSIRDISARKHAEAQSAQEVQEKNVELERFLYTVSHDLKSPVVTVRTFLGYLEQDVAGADAGRIEKDMRFMRAAADKMAQLLDAVLEMSRVGRVAAPPVRIAFRTLVDEALAAVAGRIAERGVQVKVSDHELMLCGDRLRLAEIWQNLVENAVKFMGDQSAPRIEIGMEPRDAETVFFVRDNGIGIDPRFQAKIFGLFEKIDAKAEGAGMGLAIVQRIATTLYGGRIWVESAGLGHGTCFYFTLPGAVGKAEESFTAKDRMEHKEDRRT